MLKLDFITILILSLSLLFLGLLVLRIYGKIAKDQPINKQAKKDGQIERAEQELLNKICEEVGLTVQSRRAIKSTKTHDGTKEIEDVLMYPNFTKNKQGKFTKITFNNGFSSFSEWEKNLINGFSERMIKHKLSTGPFTIEKTGVANEYRLIEQMKMDYIFDHSKPLAYVKDGKIYSQKQAIETVVKEMRNQSRKEGAPVLFCGELYDSQIPIEPRVYIPLSMSPHCLTIGMTRSGKSKGAATQLFFAALAYSDAVVDGDVWDGDKVELLIADGEKDAVDFAPLLFRSKMPIAIFDAEWTQPGVQLANQVDYVFKEFKKRRRLTRENGCSTVAELSKKTGEKYNRIILVIDEFSGFLAAEGGKNYFISSIDVPGTLPNKIMRLLKAAAAYGIHVWLLSQRYQEDSIPTPYRSLLTNGHFFSLNPDDVKVASIDPKYAAMEHGSYQLRATGKFYKLDEENKLNIPLKLPYIGSDSNLIVGLYFKDRVNNHTQFDMDLVAQPEKSEFKNEEEVWIRIKKGFLSNWKVNELASGYAIRSTLMFAEASNEHVKISIGFIEENEIKEDYLKANLNGRYDYNFLFSISEKDSLDKKINAINESQGRIRIIPLYMFKKAMISNVINASEDGDLIPWLDNYIANLKAEKVIGDQLDSNLKAVKGASTSTTWSYSQLVPNAVLSAAAVTKMAAMKDKDAKGILLEASYAKYTELAAEKEGYIKVLAGDKLHKSGTIIPEHLDAGDGGGDVVGLRADTSMHIIQTKCWSPNAPIDQEVVAKWWNVVDGWMKNRIGKDVAALKLTFVTTSYFTANAKAFLEHNGVECVDGEDLKQRFEAYKIETPKKSVGRPKKEVSPDTFVEKKPVGRPRKVA